MLFQSAPQPSADNLTLDGLVFHWIGSRRGYKGQLEGERSRETFEELLRLGVPPDVILAAIKDPARRRTEPIWDFEKRLLRHIPAAGVVKPDGEIDVILENYCRFMAAYRDQFLRSGDDVEFLLGWRRRLDRWTVDELLQAVVDVAAHTKCSFAGKNKLALLEECLKTRKGGDLRKLPVASIRSEAPISATENQAVCNRLAELQALIKEHGFKKAHELMRQKTQTQGRASNAEVAP